MITVGVTGGIGSGKSRLCRLWEEMGAEVAYADPLAKELMASDPELRDRIITAFGPESYHSDGTLNREWLSVEAFQKGRSGELNRIVHPAVAREVGKRIDLARERGIPLFAEEAALLLLRGRPPEFDYILTVTAPVEMRLQRVVDRDGLSREEIHARMDRQQTEEAMVELSDLVLVNDSDLADFDDRAKALFRLLVMGTGAGSAGN